MFVMYIGAHYKCDGVAIIQNRRLETSGTAGADFQI